MRWHGMAPKRMVSRHPRQLQLQGVVGAPHHGLGQVLELAGIHLAGAMLRGRGDVVPEPGHELRHEAVVEGPGAGSPGAARRVLAEQGADAGVVRPLVVVARQRVRGALDAARELRLGLHQLRLKDGDLQYIFDQVKDKQTSLIDDDLLAACQ